MASTAGSASTRPRSAPYEKRDNESAVAFEAFQTYRDMGPERSCAKVASALGKSTTLMDRWCSAHSWVLRASAWDREQDKLWHQEVARQRRSAVKRNLDLADAMKNLAAGSLMALAQNQTKLKPGELARLLEVAARLETAATAALPGDPGQAGGGPAGAAASREHVGALSDEERRARMAQLQIELNSRLAGGATDEDDQ